FPLVLLSASSVPRELSLGNGRHALGSSNASACLFHVCKQTSVVLHEVAATKRTRRMVAASIPQVISYFRRVHSKISSRSKRRMFEPGGLRNHLVNRSWFDIQ